MAKKWLSKKQESLRHRSVIVNALDRAVETFTSHSEKSFEDVMTNGLRPVAKAVGLSRICVYQLFEGKENLEQTYVWAHGQTTKLDDEIIILPNIPPVVRWLKDLKKGKCINERADKIAKDAAEFLATFKVKSVLFVPIFTHNKFWGVVTLEDQVRYRYFDKEYLDLLRSAASLCASALIRMNTSNNFEKAYNTLRRRERMTDTLNMMAVNFLSQSSESFEDMMNMGIRFLIESVEIDRLSIFRNSMQFDGMHTAQIYRWEKSSGGTTTSLPQLEDITFAKFAPRWEDLLASGEIINSPIRLLPEAEMLEAFGMVSLFVAPVFVSNTFWGFVLFEDHREERYFPDEVSDMLRSAAFLCANTVLRAEMKQEISDASEFNRTLIDAAPTGFTVIDEHLNVLDCNDAILDVFDTTKDYYMNHFAEFSPPYQDDGQRSDLKAIAIIKQALDGDIVTSPWTHKNSSGKLIPSEITLVRTKYHGRNVVLGYQYNLTNIKQLEQEMMDTNLLNRTLIDFAPMGISVIDENFTVINCNDAILKMFETTKEYYADHFMEFSPEFQKDGSKSKEKAIKFTSDAIKGAFEFVTVEWMHQSSTGKPIPVEVTLTRTMHNGKHVALAYQYDLRNIKKMEQELAEAEGLARSITEGSPISYVLFDEDLHPIDCNATALQLLECPDKQYFLDHYWDVFVPEKQPDKEVSVSRASILKDNADIKGKSTFEWYQRSMKGELIPMENTLSNFTYKGKKFVVSFKYDMRNTRKLTKAVQEHSDLLKVRLKEQELMSIIAKNLISKDDIKELLEDALKRIGEFFHATRAVIVSIDYETNEDCLEHVWYAEGSPRFEQTRFKFKHLLMDNFPMELPPGVTPPILSCTDAFESPNEYFRKLASVNIHGFIFAPIYMEGRLWGIVSVEQNDGPREWTDNEKNLFAMISSSIAGAIARDIYNVKLKDALYKATEASKAKGEFLSNMSHEMRTPMNAIIGMTSIGEKAKDIERKDYAFNKIKEASSHLLGVINDVLDMSKIEANKLELSPIEFDFEQMLQKTISVIHFRIDEKKQKFTVDLDSTIPRTIVGDSQRIAQVITNLLSNAVKFTPDAGHIHLDTHLISDNDGDCTIQISVKDSGIGIAPEQHDRIFQSFQQAESSTTRKFGGTGLGLAISKNIVEFMGGKMWFDSDIGKGSTFSFTFVAKRGQGSRRGLLAPGLDASNVRILIVDDDRDVLEYLQEIVQRFGIKYCDTALSGEEALRLTQEKGVYNINIVDWKMPGLDGFALSGKLKAIGATAGTMVVIMISSADFSGMEKEAAEAGVDKFVAKPLFPSSIADLISECLGFENKQNAEIQLNVEGLFEGRQILLAEDVDINREIVTTLLEPTKLGIDCAENGKEAVRLFTANPEKYDMIVMDVQMPEMDGYEATRTIRALNIEKAKSIPIVAMTANVFKDDVEKCLAAGMDSHMGKPLDFNEVIAKLRQYLPRRS